MRAALGKHGLLYPTGINKWLNSRWLGWLYQLIRWILGLVFVFSGTTKLMEPETFAVLIEAYGLIPSPLIFPIAVVLSLLEVVAGMGLIADIRGSLAIITGLLVLFVAVLGYGIRMGLDVDCGCFGPEDPEAEAFHGLRFALYRDLFMLAAVAFLYGWRRRSRVQLADVRRWVKGKRGNRTKPQEPEARMQEPE